MADFNRFITGYEVCRRAAASMGLPIPSSYATSNDAMARQFWALLTELGQYIISDHEWRTPSRSWNLSTVPGQLEYDLPSDLTFIDDRTAWNRTARMPLIGPLTQQDWALINARQLGSTSFQLMFTILENKLHFYSVPDSPQTISMSYTGRGWVQDGTNSAVYRDFVQNDADIVLFDPKMMVDGLKFFWKREKGFDTSSAEDVFMKSLEVAKYNDRPRNMLSLSGRQTYPYLGTRNLPDTGLGG